VLSRSARLAALALPLLLACVLIVAGDWRIHDGRVERMGSSPAPVAAPALPQHGAADQVTLVHQLSPSVPWPAWAGLVVLCLLPAVASLVAWSGARRGRESAFRTRS
jgi:hypothetical protein